MAGHADDVPWTPCNAILKSGAQDREVCRIPRASVGPSAARPPFSRYRARCDASRGALPRRIRLQVPRRSWAPSCLRPSRASPSGRRHGGQHDSRCARRRMIRPSPPVTTPSCITPAGKATEHGPSRRRSIDARLAGLRTLPAGFRACRRPTRGQRLIAETRARSSGYRAEWERSAQNHCRRSLSVSAVSGCVPV